MTAIFLFIFCVIGLNCIPFIHKTKFPFFEKKVVKSLMFSSIVLILFSTFYFINLRLKGKYTLEIITITFIFFTSLYFALFKNTKKKILFVVLLSPLLILSICFLLFSQIKLEHKIDNNTKISVRKNSFLSCGEEINLSKSKFLIFDETTRLKNNICLLGIEKIETLKTNNKNEAFLIYHNSNGDIENPYRYSFTTKE